MMGEWTRCIWLKNRYKYRGSYEHSNESSISIQCGKSPDQQSSYSRRTLLRVVINYCYNNSPTLPARTFGKCILEARCILRMWRRYDDGKLIRESNGENRLPTWCQICYSPIGTAALWQHFDIAGNIHRLSHPTLCAIFAIYSYTFLPQNVAIFRELQASQTYTARSAGRQRLNGIKCTYWCVCNNT